MHELYAWPFAESIRAGVGSVMMAYNAVSEFEFSLIELMGSKELIPCFFVAGKQHRMHSAPLSHQ